MKRCLLLAGLLLAPAAHGADPLPQMGRYMPLYPALYFSGGYEQDEADRSYDQAGRERASAAPNSGSSQLPARRLHADFTWYFPMFEAAGLPFFSTRLHTASIRLRHARAQTEGALADFVANTEDDARTEADDLRNNGSGIGDVEFEFGSFLYGSANWRERRRTPLAVLLLAGVRAPFGNYDRDAPVSAGTNTAAAHVQLALHAQPWRGGLVDAGVGLRAYVKNQDPAFGGLVPVQQGDDMFWDLSLAQRVGGGLYLGAFASGREGDPSLYENPRFAPNMPAPPDTTPESDNFPVPGRYQDSGTALRSAGLSLSYFLSQRWLLGLHWVHPLSGRSGEFDLPFVNRQPAGCTPGATGCQITPGETVRVDGMGPARTLASDRLLLTLRFNFGQGDAFTCTGCEN